jgi:hypothetical protein
MNKLEHAEAMEFFLLILLVLIGPLSLVYGVDSRRDERARSPEWRRML